MTANQIVAVERNLEKIEAGKKTAIERQTEINVNKIAVAFATAKENKIKRPKLRLGDFLFSLAPDTGANAGAIYVKTGETYLGKVVRGIFYPVKACTTEQIEEIKKIAADVAAAAKAYGFRSGNCSCCGRELTRADSIELGIGPICAERYGF